MKFFKTVLVIGAFLFASASHAFDLSSLKNAVTNGTASSLIDGLISTDNIEVSDLVGTWKNSGAAVSFKSENLLQKAGGAAAATTIENKLNPYYKKAGLQNATFTFTSDGAFTITMKNGKSISGTVKKGSTAGTMIFNFSKLTTSSKLTSITAYVSKGTSLDILFDASKLITIANTLAKVSGNSTLSTASSLLSSYKGVYAGFKLSK